MEQLTFIAGLNCLYCASPLAAPSPPFFCSKAPFPISICRTSIFGGAGDVEAAPGHGVPAVKTAL
jgi:hypothetical protein